MSRVVIACVVTGVLSFGGGLLLAQAGEGHPANVQVLSGSDVGVRLGSLRIADGSIQGTLVVKVDGQWVDVSTPPKVMKAAR